MSRHRIQGWSLVAIWVTAALAILFFASVADDLDRWMLAHQHLAGWAQGIGSVLALIGAFLILERQVLSQREDEAERARRETVSRLQAITAVIAHVSADAKHLRKLPLSKTWQAMIIESFDFNERLMAALPLFELPDSIVTHQITMVRSASFVVRSRVKNRKLINSGFRVSVNESLAAIERESDQVAIICLNLMSEIATKQETAKYVERARTYSQS